MKMHSRNRKRKIDEISGGAGDVSQANPYSLSFGDDSQQTSKRFRGPVAPEEDEDVQILSTSNA